jgi:hypothetical protein
MYIMCVCVYVCVNIMNKVNIEIIKDYKLVYYIMDKL